MRNQEIVVKHSFHPEGRQPIQVAHTGYGPGAMHSEPPRALSGGHQKHLDPHLRADGRTHCASNECSIERDVAGESALRVLDTIVPMKEDGQVERVAHRGTSLQTGLNRLCHLRLHNTASVG